jgi:L-histidine N-alpha-methyltransferase
MALTQSPVATADTRFSIEMVPAGRAITTLIEDVRHGFELQPRQLPPKYFYDERGSELFDRICDTAEYYPTRTEAALIEDRAEAIVASVQPDHITYLGLPRIHT